VINARGLILLISGEPKFRSDRGLSIKEHSCF